jgi:hypothetical protein
MGCSVYRLLVSKLEVTAYRGHNPPPRRRINIGFPKGSNSKVRLTQGVIDTKGRRNYSIAELLIYAFKTRRRKGWEWGWRGVAAVE